MKISIVIPVYNEADSLAACLQAIAHQTLKPYEVIVVDNNSDDGTRSVAASFGFVKLIKEKRQGVIHARTRGFDAAKGDIIARIDGDSILPANWVETVANIFETSDTDAVSGTALYYNVALPHVFNQIDIFFRRRLSWQLSGHLFLWGANMAMKREAWTKVKSSLCSRGGMHEDFDIAIHLQRLGGKVTFDERLEAYVSSRRIEASFWDFMKYAWLNPSTYAQHNINVKRYLYPIILICAVGYWPSYMLHKGYNPDTERFSLTKLLLTPAGVARVDPTANVALD